MAAEAWAAVGAVVAAQEQEAVRMSEIVAAGEAGGGGA